LCRSETPESLRLFFWKIGIFKLSGNKESGYLSVEVINLQTETIHDMESIKKAIINDGLFCGFVPTVDYV
jgi:hypothetical protein